MPIIDIVEKAQAQNLPSREMWWVAACNGRLRVRVAHRIFAHSLEPFLFLRHLIALNLNLKAKLNLCIFYFFTSRNRMGTEPGNPMIGACLHTYLLC